MALSRLGDFIELVDRRNDDGLLTFRDVRGISTNKQFIGTKANLEGVNLRSYKIVGIHEFAYVADTSRRGEKIALAFCIDRPCLISSIYTVFCVRDERRLLPSYLMMFFNRPEFDRYARFNSWGSARETFSWDELCAIELEIPPIEVQIKYVEIYESLLKNLRCYENGIEDLKLICDGYIEELRRRIGVVPIGPYIEQVDERNTDLSIKLAMGVDNKKTFVPPKQVAKAERSAKIVRNGSFAYNRATTRNGEKISIAFREGPDCVVSAAYGVFRVKDTQKLNPKYLLAWFRRSEFDRYARYMSKGSAHEFFEFSDMQEVEIPIPDISVQNAVVSILETIEKRQTIVKEIKAALASACPILVRGSILEANL